MHTLYNFDVNKKLAQVILFGQPEIRNLIDSRPEVANRVYTWLTLNSLSLATQLNLSDSDAKSPAVIIQLFLKALCWM